jgi:hypothetical protein
VGDAISIVRLPIAQLRRDGGTQPRVNTKAEDGERVYSLKAEPLIAPCITPPDSRSAAFLFFDRCLTSRH